MKPALSIGVALIAVGLTSGCRSAYPTLEPASSEIHLAVMDFQLAEQIHGKYSVIIVDIHDAGRLFAPIDATMRALRQYGVPPHALMRLRVLPDLPQDEIAYLSVWARPERVYPDELVIWGMYSRGSAEDGSYRYKVRRIDGFWQVVDAERIEVVTDCYGHYWLPGSGFKTGG